MPILDTTFLIADQRKKGAQSFLQELIDEGEPLLVPAQAAIEFAAGCADPAEAMRKLRDAFVLVPCGPDIALEAARLARKAFSDGTFTGWADIQIAAAASHEGMAIVSRNGRHFEALDLRVRVHP